MEAPMAVATQNPLNLPGAPRFATLEEERRHRKQRLAGAFRLFSRFGFDEGVAGHITARDPERLDHFWVNPFGMHFGQVRASDLILVNDRGEVVEGKYPVNGAAFAIHSQVHAARPDVVAAAHAHSLYGKAWSSLSRLLDPITQDACAFYEDHSLFADFTGVVYETSEGERIAQALGEKKAVILRNHGLLTVGHTVDEAAWWFITMERSCQAQLLAEAAGTAGKNRRRQRGRHPTADRIPHGRLVPVPTALGAHRPRTTRPAGVNVGASVPLVPSQTYLKMEAAISRGLAHSVTSGMDRPSSFIEHATPLVMPPRVSCPPGFTMNVPLTPIRCLYRAVDLYGKKTGVISGPSSFTYAQFGERCERLAAGLLSEGIRPGDRVAYLSFNNHQLLEGYYGPPLVRAISMPLNVRLQPAELTAILNHAGAGMLVFESDFAPLVDELRKACPSIRRYVAIDRPVPQADLFLEDLLARDRIPRPDIFSFDENEIAELFYTSGSTGTPKGVMLSHRTLYVHALALLASFPCKDTDVELHTIPLFHANGWGRPQSITMSGAKHVMVRRFEPTAVFRLIQEEKATAMTAGSHHGQRAAQLFRSRQVRPFQHARRS